MSNWVCRKCGTINKDPFSMIGIPPDTPAWDMFEDRMKQRREVENRGEMWKDKCERCSEERI